MIHVLACRRGARAHAQQSACAQAGRWVRMVHCTSLGGLHMSHGTHWATVGADCKAHARTGMSESGIPAC